MEKRPHTTKTAPGITSLLIMNHIGTEAMLGSTFHKFSRLSSSQRS